MKAKTNGSIDIQGFPNGQMGGSRDMIEAVSNGTQQLVTEGPANFGAWIPSISVTEAPFIWKNPAHLINALNGPLLEKYNEVQKYIVLTGHIMTPRPVVVNDAFWQKIPAADRKIVEDALKTHMAWADAEIQKQEVALLDEFKAAGVTIIQPDVESFRKATMAVVPAKFEAKWGKGTFDSIANMK